MRQISLIISLTVLTLGSKAQHQTNMKINPDAPVVQTKSITINATPEKIWHVLSDVKNWSQWNEKIDKVQIEEKLIVGTEFIWKSGGTKIKSKVHTLNINKTLGWTGKTVGAQAIHNWHFTETENGTKITVEESMEGWLIGLMKKKMNTILEKDMAAWLEQLKLESERNMLVEF